MSMCARGASAVWRAGDQLRLNLMVLVQTLKVRSAEGHGDVRRVASRRFSSLADLDAVLSAGVTDVDFKLDDNDIELAIKVGLAGLEG